MTMRTLRSMTDEDGHLIIEAGRRFCRRHGLRLPALLVDQHGDEEGFGPADRWEDLDTVWSTIWDHADNARDGGRLRRLWLAVYRRAVREPEADTFGWGYIGRHSE